MLLTVDSAEKQITGYVQSALSGLVPIIPPPPIVRDMGAGGVPGPNIIPAAPDQGKTPCAGCRKGTPTNPPAILPPAPSGLTVAAAVPVTASGTVAAVASPSVPPAGVADAGYPWWAFLGLLALAGGITWAVRE